MRCNLDSSNAQTGEGTGDAATSIDAEKAIERLGGSREFYQTVVGMFRQDGVAQHTGLLSATAAADYPAALRHAHTLKGLATIIGANPLAASAAHIEHVIKLTDTSCAEPSSQAQAQLQVALAQLEAQLSLALDALARFGEAA